MFHYATLDEAWYKSGYVPAGRLCHELRMNYRVLLRELAADPDIAVYVVARRRTFAYYLLPADAERIRRRLGTPLARAMRKRRQVNKPKSDPLPYRCPGCGKTGRQWRDGFTRAGNRMVHCQHCNNKYVIGARRPPLDTTCPHCGANKDQHRKEQYPDKMYVRCKPCGRWYTVRPNPDVEREKQLAEPGVVVRPRQWQETW